MVDHLSASQQKALIIRGRALINLIEAVEVLVTGAPSPKELASYLMARDHAPESLRTLGDVPPAEPNATDEEPKTLHEQTLVEWLKSLQARGAHLKGGTLTVKLPPMKPKPAADAALQPPEANDKPARF